MDGQQTEYVHGYEVVVDLDADGNPYRARARLLGRTVAIVTLCEHGKVGTCDWCPDDAVHVPATHHRAGKAAATVVLCRKLGQLPTSGKAVQA